MAKNEKTSKRVAKIASNLLRKKSTPKNVKSVSGSALTQVQDKLKVKFKTKPKVSLKKKPTVRKK